MKIFFKEPLVLFLLIGGLFFAAFNFFGDSGFDDSKTIVVDRVSLLRFMQLKTKAVDQKLLLRSFDALPEDKLQKLIADYVREEALYREAQAIGLDKNDPVIKGRVLQKLEFITQEYSEAVLKVNDEQLEKYFEDHKQDYYIEPYVTFTHVFFDRESHGDALANKLAVAKLQELNKNKTSFSEGLQHGDRFPFHVNYVERTPDLISSHFGEPMSKQIFAIPLAEISNTEGVWRGPYTSAYGLHLIMVSRLEEGRFPKLVEVVSQVHQDAQRQQTRKSLEDAYQAIVETYTVELSADLNNVATEVSQPSSQFENRKGSNTKEVKLSKKGGL